MNKLLYLFLVVLFFVACKEEKPKMHIQNEIQKQNSFSDSSEKTKAFTEVRSGDSLIAIFSSVTELSSSSAILQSSSSKKIRTEKSVYKRKIKRKKIFTESSASTLPESSSASIEYGFITDNRNNKKYKTVKIAGQTWMAENLNFEYNEGTAKSYCYKNKEEYCDKFGRLYTYLAAIDSALLSKENIICTKNTHCNLPKNWKGICPEGFHLPTIQDFNSLKQSALTANPGNPNFSLKANELWKDKSDSAEYNSLGFNALPTGYHYFYGNFYDINKTANFWSATSNDSTSAFSFIMSYMDSEIKTNTDDKLYAFSVRCIAD